MIEFTRDILRNGLPLLHHFDPTTPFVVVNLLYKVGARDEDPQRTGFAHLFEHLMFEGTETVPDYDHPLQEAGGINNAFTNNDYTNYYVKLPRENARLALFLEADRMQHLDINENTLGTQKKVVIEEFKENYTNKPYGDVWHILRELVYEKHPYRWPTIGKDYEHIAAAPLSEVVSFYKRYYHPANAILCIAGNITHEEAAALADQYLGDVPSAGDSNGHSFEEPEQSREKRLTVQRDIPMDAIYIAFKMPGRSDDRYYHSDILSDILAGSKSSRFREKLVKQEHLFIGIDAYITGTIDTGMFVIEGKIKEGISVEAAEAAIWRELDLIHETGPDDRELEKVKNKLVTYMNFSENNLLSRAIGLCYHEMLGDAAGINKEEDRYLAITHADVTAFIRDFLTRERANTLHYLKRS